ncbi:MAG: pyruvate kinase alpha/beta domain-containing protein [Bacillota bacterium]
MTVYFEKRGKENTSEVARLVIGRAKELGINYIVVATNTGFTARHFQGKGPKVVCVTHQNGFREPGMDEMGPAARDELKQAGMDVLTTTHLFGNVERAITQQQGGLYPGGIISAALRMFSQGTKVAVEIAVMALDAGLVPFGQPVISVGGSGGGADTALVLVPSHSKTIFDTEVLEVICKPRHSRQ